MDIINVIKKLNKLNISELKLVFKKIYKNKKCPHFKKDIIIKLCEPFQMKYKIGGGRGGGRSSGRGGGRGGQILMFASAIVCRISEPQLSLGVVPPAHHRTVVNNSAGVVYPRSNRNGRPTCAKVNWRGGRRGEVWTPGSCR